MFTEHHMLLRNLARNRDVDDSTVKSAASFMCNVTDDGSAAVLERGLSCFVDTGHEKLFRRQVMQHNGISEEQSSRQ